MLVAEIAQAQYTIPTSFNVDARVCIMGQNNESVRRDTNTCVSIHCPQVNGCSLRITMPADDVASHIVKSLRTLKLACDQKNNFT